MTVTAAVLCGGLGTRLRPVTGDSLPKCLAPVAGRPFLSYVLGHLRDQGARRAVLCTGHLGSRIIEEFNIWDGGMEIRFSQEKEPLGTGGALKHALPLLDTDPVLVVNGDTFCKFDLKWMLDTYHRGGGGSASLSDRGTFAGVCLLSRQWLASIPDGTQDLAALLYGKAPFIDIGTPEGYARAEQFLREQGVIG